VGDGMEASGNLDFIYTHIKNLRKKLNEAGCADYIPRFAVWAINSLNETQAKYTRATISAAIFVLILGH
jgi:hypothetical protein